MSEYQHYAFAAVERPLTPAEVAEMRALAKRAALSPTTLVAEYHSGDFDGRPDDLMLRLYDVHTYVSSWGTVDFQLRLPKGALQRDVVKPFLVEERLEVRQKGDLVLLTFHAEHGDYPDAAEHAAGWLPGLSPLRADLLAGDMRALYLGWLAAAAAGHVPGEAREPAPPPGLDAPSPPLMLLARLLRLDPHVIAAAGAPAAEARTAAAIVAAGKARAAAEAARVADQASAARTQVLQALAARAEQAWAEVEDVIGMPGGGPTKTAAFKAKAKLLQDLRDLADHDGTRAAFEARLAELRERKKVPSFWLFYDPPRTSKAFG